MLVDSREELIESGPLDDARQIIFGGIVFWGLPLVGRLQLLAHFGKGADNGANQQLIYPRFDVAQIFHLRAFAKSDDLCQLSVLKLNGEASGGGKDGNL